MFSVIQRAQSVGNYLLSVVIVLSIAISLTSYSQLLLNDYSAIPGSIDVTRSANAVSSVRRNGGSAKQPKENVKIQFALDTDLSPLFNWNTKQLFIYLTAEYDGITDPNHEESTVVFWDKIIQSKDEAVVNLSKQRSKYNVWDFYPSFANRTSSIKLKYNIQPYIGPLIWGELDTDYEYQFPPVSK